jgi:hypothetical protein
LQLDLITMARPNASPAIAEAFGRWSSAHQQHAEASEADEDTEEMSRTSGDAFETLMALPCFTPGDFMVKAYVDLADDVGYPVGDERNADLSPWPFEISQTNLTRHGGSHDKIAQAQRYRDLSESDLGRCMIALGMVDFDAEMWIAQARRVGKQVTVLRDTEGKRSLFFGCNDGCDHAMEDMLQCLMAGGLEAISEARRIALADAIEANHPDLIVDQREAVTA